MAEAREIVARLEVDDAYRVTKAFAIYFELTNLAETNHRKRRRRAGNLHAEQPPLAGSFRGTLARMRTAGISADDALAALRKLQITPVFTAHPTEVARRTVLLKRRRICAVSGKSGPVTAARGRCGRIRIVDSRGDHFTLADRRSTAEKTRRD